MTVLRIFCVLVMLTGLFVTSAGCGGDSRPSMMTPPPDLDPPTVGNPKDPGGGPTNVTPN